MTPIQLYALGEIASYDTQSAESVVRYPGGKVLSHVLSSFARVSRVFTALYFTGYSTALGGPCVLCERRCPHAILVSQPTRLGAHRCTRSHWARQRHFRRQRVAVAAEATGLVLGSNLTNKTTNVCTATSHGWLMERAVVQVPAQVRDGGLGALHRRLTSSPHSINAANLVVALGSRCGDGRCQAVCTRPCPSLPPTQRLAIAARNDEIEPLWIGDHGRIADAEAILAHTVDRQPVAGVVLCTA